MLRGDRVKFVVPQPASTAQSQSVGSFDEVWVKRAIAENALAPVKRREPIFYLFKAEPLKDVASRCRICVIVFLSAHKIHVQGNPRDGPAKAVFHVLPSFPCFE